jgi:cbb3-type cytochrome oxidase maturation protein
MEILYLLIPLSLVLVVLIGLAFWWAVQAGQLDDLDRPGQAILMDDDTPRPGA